MNDRHVMLGRFGSRLIRAVGDRIAPAGKGKGRLCILSYHRVLAADNPFLDQEPTVSTFRWQMELLAECFNVLPLHVAVDMLAKDRMPPRAVCITFDDGYRSFHELALPILKNLGLPATVFISSGYINQTNMWNDRIIEAMKALPVTQLDLQEIGMGRYAFESVGERKRAINLVIDGLKYRSPEARNQLTQRIEHLSMHKDVSGLMLTPEMVLDLSREDIEIGGHTISHPILSSLDDESAYREMEVGKRQLEEIIGKSVRMFAYPNGKFGIDFDNRHVRMAKDIGFTSAFTTSVGPATARHDLHLLPRSRPWDPTPRRFASRLLYWLAGRY